MNYEVPKVDTGKLVSETVSTKVQLREETLALHAGYRHDPATLATTVPIYLSNAYAFETVEHASDVFDLRT